MNVTIVVTTYAPPGEAAQRRRAWEQAWATWKEHLHFTDPLIQSAVHIADDGSEGIDYTEAFWRNLNRLEPLCPDERLTYSQQSRWGVGASLNAGFRQAFSQGDLVLYMVDDWQLTSEFDLTPWLNLASHSSLNVGCVRLGPPHPHISGTVEMFEEGWMLRLARHHYAFSFRPALYHRRFWDFYGPFDEDISSLECERLYNERWAAFPQGPDIAYALPVPWEHIYSSELSALVPGGRS